LNIWFVLEEVEAAAVTAASAAGVSVRTIMKGSSQVSIMMEHYKNLQKANKVTLS
jgi:hypothetical protein